MKPLLQILFFYLLAAHQHFPQWTNQNPVPDGNHLWSTFFIDDNTGWIVGTGGLIKKTTNAGLDWTQQNSGTTLALKAVQFVDQNIGWICGEGGLIFKSTNGGQSWFELTNDTTAELIDLQFCNLDIGYAVGYNGTILKTTDGGLIWVSQSSGTTNNLSYLDFVDSLSGYVFGNLGGKFLKTTDGGLTWIEKTPIVGFYGTINCVEFINANVGWIGGGLDHDRGLISKTTDGGETWITTTTYYGPIYEVDLINHDSQHSILIDSGIGIRFIYFKDSNNGYAVGGTSDGWSRVIYCTTNSGVTWQKKYGNHEQTGLLSVYVTSGGKGWAVGYSGVIYMTEDNGSTWAQILSGTIGSWTGDRIYSVFMVNDSVGWTGGSRKGTYKYPVILKTTNGGKIWKTNFERIASTHYTFIDIFFIDENIGWASTDQLGTYKTTNGGETWFNTYGLPADEIFFISQDTGWTASSLAAGIRKTTDGGGNWVQKNSTPNSSIIFTDINNGWAVGDGGNILKSTDTGESWVSKTSGTTSDLNSVRFYDSNIGMCAGNSGTVLLSTDGGENWISKSSGVTSNLNSVAFPKMNSVWIAGENGTIQNSIDLGDTWISYSGFSGGMTSLHFLNEYTGWVADGGNNIYKYSVEPLPPSIWSNEIIVEDAAYTESSKVLTIGQHADATDSIDLILGEYELPPSPPTGIFDARFNLPTNPVVSSLKDYRDSVKKEITWTITFQPGSAGYPMTISWDSTSFPVGTFYLKDCMDGSFVNVNMKNQSSYTLTEPAITSLNIIYNGVSSMVSVNNDWNMISVPLLAEDMSLSNLFPTATSPAYGFDGGYVTEDTLVGGEGYWLKFDGNQQIQIFGSRMGDIVPIETGWNLFGAYEENIPISQITTTPSGIVATNFFGFNDGYYIADTLKSGHGYWVRVTKNGVINLNCGGSLKDGEQEQFAEIDKHWGKIKIADNEGKSITLYVTEEKTDLSLYDLPPIPPAAIFDSRYSSGSLVENLSSEKTILIISESYPITIRAEGMNITIRDLINGELLNEALNNGEELRITNNKIKAILVTGRVTGGLPISYELYQNYPNPFNPGTTIKFAITKESNVNLSIYNALGELVSTLVNEQLKTGYHEYEFDAANLASGVYLYRIIAGDFVETKKMVLLR